MHRYVSTVLTDVRADVPHNSDIIQIHTSPVSSLCSVWPPACFEFAPFLPLVVGDTMNPLAYERVTQELEMAPSAGQETASRNLASIFEEDERELETARRLRQTALRWQCLKPRRVRSVSRLRDVGLSMYGSTTVLGLGLLIVQTLVPIVGKRRKLHMNDGEIGAALGFIGLGKVFGNLPAAWSQRRLGDKATMLLGCGLFVAAGVCVALARHPLQMYIGLSLVGGYQALCQVGRQSWSRVMFKKEIRGRALGMIGGVTRLASVVGPALAGLVAKRTTPRSALLFTPLSAAIGLLLLLLLPKEQTAAKSSDATSLAQASLYRAYRAACVSHYAELIKTAIFGLLVFWLRAARLLLLPLAALNERLYKSVSPDRVGFLVAASFIVDCLVGIFIAGRIMDGLGRKPAAALTCIGFAIGFAALGHADTWIQVTLSALVLGFGNGFSSGLIMTISTDLAPEDNRGAFLSLFRFIADIGVIVGSDLSGAIANESSFKAACWTQSGVALCCLAFVIVVLPETVRATTRHPIPQRPNKRQFLPSYRTKRPNSLLGAAATLSRAAFRVSTDLRGSRRSPASAPTYSIIDDDDDDHDNVEDEPTGNGAADEHPSGSFKVSVHHGASGRSPVQASSYSIVDEEDEDENQFNDPADNTALDAPGHTKKSNGERKQSYSLGDSPTRQCIDDDDDSAIVEL